VDQKLRITRQEAAVPWEGCHDGDAGRHHEGLAYEQGFSLMPFAKEAYLQSDAARGVGISSAGA
jgi:hypothetical protein